MCNTSHGSSGRQRVKARSNERTSSACECDSTLKYSVDVSEILWRCVHVIDAPVDAMYSTLGGVVGMTARSIVIGWEK